MSSISDQKYNMKKQLQIWASSGLGSSLGFCPCHCIFIAGRGSSFEVLVLYLCLAKNHTQFKSKFILT